MNHYVVIYTCKKGQAPRVMEEAGDHILWVRKQIKDKRFICAGPFINESGQYDDGLVIMRADSEDELRTIVESDPFVKNGVRDYKVRLWDYHVDENGYRVEFPPELK